MAEGDRGKNLARTSGIGRRGCTVQAFGQRKKEVAKSSQGEENQSNWNGRPNHAEKRGVLLLLGGRTTTGWGGGKAIGEKKGKSGPGGGDGEHHSCGRRNCDDWGGGQR